MAQPCGHCGKQVNTAEDSKEGPAAAATATASSDGCSAPSLRVLAWSNSCAVCSVIGVGIGIGIGVGINVGRCGFLRCSPTHEPEFFDMMDPSQGIADFYVEIDPTGTNAL
jgi:hypothetical protein